MSDEFYMQVALKEARKAFDSEEVPVGAIIVLQNSIIGRGFNQVETLNDSTAHAEIIALTAAFNFTGSKYLPEASLYVTVEPCLMCAGALYWSKIGRVIFGAPDIKNGYSRFCVNNAQPFHRKTQLASGILKDESAALMKAFFQARR